MDDRSLQELKEIRTMIERDAVLQRVAWFRDRKWLQSCEFDRLANVFDPTFVFEESLQHAETVHAHLKVRDVAFLPEEEFLDQNARVAYRKDGFVKFQFSEGINMIFSSIPISEDDVRSGDSAPERMYLDHVGIDLREVNPSSSRLFDALPEAARQRGWGHVSQGDSGRPVYCCHIEVGRKHWIYPEDSFTERGARALPLEFALGELKLNDASSGCDLRPSDPRYHDAPPDACCAEQQNG